MNEPISTPVYTRARAPHAQYPALSLDCACTCMEFHSNENRNSDGTCQRWRRNGKTQLWKRSPERFRVPVKHGLYRYDQVTDTWANFVHCACQCPYKRES